MHSSRETRSALLKLAELEEQLREIPTNLDVALEYLNHVGHTIVRMLDQETMSKLSIIERTLRYAVCPNAESETVLKVFIDILTRFTEGRDLRTFSWYPQLHKVILNQDYRSRCNHILLDFLLTTLPPYEAAFVLLFLNKSIDDLDKVEHFNSSLQLRNGRMFFDDRVLAVEVSQRLRSGAFNSTKSIEIVFVLLLLNQIPSLLAIVSKILEVEKKFATRREGALIYYWALVVLVNQSKDWQSIRLVVTGLVTVLNKLPLTNPMKVHPLEVKDVLARNSSLYEALRLYREIGGLPVDDMSNACLNSIKKICAEDEMRFWILWDGTTFRLGPHMLGIKHELPLHSVPFLLEKTAIDIDSCIDELKQQKVVLSATASLTKGPMVSKTFFLILDTNVIIDEITLIAQLASMNSPKLRILVPETAISELEGLALNREKGEMSTKALFQVKNLFKELLAFKLLIDGNITTQFEIHTQSPRRHLMPRGDLRVNDDLILRSCTNFLKDSGNQVVFLVSNDINMQLKAKALGIEICSLEDVVHKF